MMKGRRREGSDGGEKERGGVMERRRREGELWRGGGRDGGGREWCEVRSEEEPTHLGSLSLASAHGCWPSLSGCSSSFTCGRLMGIPFHSSLFVPVHGHAFPVVGIRLCWWAVVSICVCLASLVGIHVQCGGAVRSSWRSVM